MAHELKLLSTDPQSGLASLASRYDEPADSDQQLF